MNGKRIKRSRTMTSRNTASSNSSSSTLKLSADTVRNKSDQSLLSDRRNLPARTRKKNPLFYSDDMYVTSETTNEKFKKSDESTETSRLTRTEKNNLFKSSKFIKYSADGSVGYRIGAQSKRIVNGKLVRPAISKVAKKPKNKLPSKKAATLKKKRQMQMEKKKEAIDEHKFEIQNKNESEHSADESESDRELLSPSAVYKVAERVKSFKMPIKKKVKPDTSEEDERRWQRDQAEKVGLKLRNLLKLPKAFNWICCEFYYSVIDKAVFDYYQNEFILCLREKFPFIRNFTMTRAQWSMIRRLLGKPRRCSPLFFKEEIADLNRKRAIIRSLQKGEISKVCSLNDIPLKLPLLPQNTTRLTARFYRNSKTQHEQGGIYIGCVSHVEPSSNRYKLVFDNPNLRKEYVHDLDVLYSDQLRHVSRNTMIRSILCRSKNPKNGRAIKLVNDCKRRIKFKIIRHAVMKQKLKSLKNNADFNNNNNNNNNSSNNIRSGSIGKTASKIKINYDNSPSSSDRPKEGFSLHKASVYKQQIKLRSLCRAVSKKEPDIYDINNDDNNNNDNNDNNNKNNNNVCSGSNRSDGKFEIIDDDRSTMIKCASASSTSRLKKMPTVHRVFDEKLMNANKDIVHNDSSVVINQASDNTKDLLLITDDEASSNFNKNFQQTNNDDFAMLVASLKKIINYKQSEVDKLQRMNTEIELAALYKNRLDKNFCARYATTIVSLELLNRDLLAALNNVREHRFLQNESGDSLLTDIERKSMKAAGELLSKNAVAISNDSDNADEKTSAVLSIIQEFTSLMVQVKSVIVSKDTSYSYPLDTIDRKIAKIKSTLSPRNKTLFDTHVTVHMRQLQAMLMKTDRLNSYISRGRNEHLKEDSSSSSSIEDDEYKTDE